MALAPKLELRQGQQLVMTPQLQQAIRLLQLSNVELCTFVEAEVERNPLLERDEVAPEPSPETPNGARDERRRGRQRLGGRRGTLAASMAPPARGSRPTGAPAQRRRARGRRMGFAAAAHATTRSAARTPTSKTSSRQGCRWRTI